MTGIEDRSRAASPELERSPRGAAPNYSENGAIGAGVLEMDLLTACLAVLEIPRGKARAHALTFTWAKSAGQFLDNIVLARSSARHPGANSGSPN